MRFMVREYHKQGDTHCLVPGKVIAYVLADDEQEASVIWHNVVPRVQGLYWGLHAFSDGEDEDLCCCEFDGSHIGSYLGMKVAHLEALYAWYHLHRKDAARCPR